MQNPWTPEEDATLHEMRSQGLKCPTIAAAIGRSPDAVKNRLYYLSLNEDRRHRRRVRINAAARAAYRATVSSEGHGPTAKQINVPEEVFMERSRRQSAPRDITAILCGDPPPGYSALDRKRQEVRA